MTYGAAPSITSPYMSKDIGCLCYMVMNLDTSLPVHPASSFCSHLAMKGAPARAIQELAGHADLSTTRRYVPLSPAATEDAIRLLDGRQSGLEPLDKFGEILDTREAAKPRNYVYLRAKALRWT